MVGVLKRPSHVKVIDVLIFRKYTPVVSPVKLYLYHFHILSLKQVSNECWLGVSIESVEDELPSADEDSIHMEHPYSKGQTVSSSNNGSSTDGSLLISTSEPYFRKYDALEKYLRTGVYSSMPYCRRDAVKRCAKRFCLQGQLLCQIIVKKRIKYVSNYI